MKTLFLISLLLVTLVAVSSHSLVHAEVTGDASMLEAEHGLPKEIHVDAEGATNTQDDASADMPPFSFDMGEGEEGSAGADDEQFDPAQMEAMLLQMFGGDKAKMDEFIRELEKGELDDDQLQAMIPNFPGAEGETEVEGDESPMEMDFQEEEQPVEEEEEVHTEL